MYPRTHYEMTEADLEKILSACKPTPASETQEHKKERLAREAEERRLQEIEILRLEIAERQKRLDKLTTPIQTQGGGV